MIGLRAAVFLLFCAARVQAAAVDLHAHILMDEAFPGVFSGRPSGAPAGVKSRKGRFRNQVSLKDLEAADVRLVAASLYAPPVFSWLKGGTHKALLKQIAALEAWAAEDPRVRLVRSPDEAEAVLKSKEWGLGVLVAVEGSHGADTEERLEALWDKGMRLLTIAHFEDGPWAGAAKVRYFPRPTCKPGREDRRRNPKGLLPLGETLAAYAVKKGLLLDLAHSSDKTVSDLAARHPGLPLLFTHEAARELTSCERMVSTEQLKEVKRSRGMVGVTFAAGYVGEDIPALVRHAEVIAREAGPEAVALGSDYNGFISRVEGAADSRGYAPVLQALKDAGIPADGSAEAFVALWRRALAYGIKAP